MQEHSISSFNKGDKESYKLVFNNLYPVMCLYSKKFISNSDDAEDIVQELFIELWNQRIKFDSYDQIKAFLYLSIKNKCLNLLKHLTVQEKYFSEMIADNEPLYEEYALEAEIINNLHSAINEMPQQRKEVILLSMQGLKNETIAQDMNISMNTVKLHKKLAYQQLREKLDNSPFLMFLL